LTKALDDSNIYLAATENRNGGRREEAFLNLENFIV